jgi:glycosyltransferase involved in cell wall biosynthesis
LIGRASTSDLGLPSGVTLLIVATKSSTIGAFLAPFARHFRALGWQVDAAAAGASGDPTLRDSFDNVHDLPLSRSLLDAPGLVRGERAIAALLETGPDIVHVHTPIAAFLTRLAVRRMPLDRRPVVAYTAHGFHFHDGGHRATNAAFLVIERLAGRWTDRLVVINDEDEATALRHRIVPRRRLVRMPGIGLDTQWYAPSSVDPDSVTRARDQYDIPANVPLFVVVAELTPRKRVGDAIAALARMHRKDAHLVLAGDGPQRSLLERRASELGLQDRVRFAGVVADVRPIVRAATALILPSRREGLARAVMEALALEVPVIASTARGNRELVGTDAGIIVRTGEVPALASAMDRLIDHPDEARAMGVRGRERMVGQYDLNVLVRMHEELYREVLAERPSRVV